MIMIRQVGIYKFIISELGISDNCPSDFGQKTGTFYSNFNKRWKKYHLMKDRFEAQYARWINQEFRLPPYSIQ
jgi:hypothetical protein